MKKLALAVLFSTLASLGMGNHILPRASGWWRQRFQQWHISERSLAYAESCGQLRRCDSGSAQHDLRGDKFQAQPVGCGDVSRREQCCLAQMCRSSMPARSTISSDWP